MITSTDIEYQNAKLIKQGKEEIDITFKQLADWISDKYKVKVLNINHKLMDNQDKIRVGIAVDSYSDYLKFKEDDERWSNYDSAIQDEIAEKYLELNNNVLKIQSDKKILGLFAKQEKPKVNDIFVATSAFEPIAKEEVNSQIPEKRIKELISEINSSEIWTIARCFAKTTLFVFTDKQKADFKNIDNYKDIENSYFELLKEYDEFNYWKRENFTLEIDSKQNFDNNYKSSWFYYDR